jgi:hypothetical protein
MTVATEFLAVIGTMGRRNRSNIPDSESPEHRQLVSFVLLSP